MIMMMTNTMTIWFDETMSIMVTQLHHISDRKLDAKKKRKEKRGEICNPILIICPGSLPFLVDVNLNTYAYTLPWNIRYEYVTYEFEWTLETIHFTSYLLILSILARL